jgi:hypothetical protein
MSIATFKIINNRLLCDILSRVMKTEELVYFIWNILEKTCMFPLHHSVSKAELRRTISKELPEDSDSFHFSGY